MQLENESSWILPDNLKLQELKFRNGEIAPDKTNDFGSYKLLNNGLDSQIEAHNACGIRAIHFSKCMRYLIKKNQILTESVADMGAGAGFVAAAMKRFFPEANIDCYEISGDAVDYGRKNFPDIRFYQQEISPCSQFETKYNLIYAKEFYPFTRTNNFSFQSKYIDLFLKYLYPNGWLILELVASPRCLLNNRTNLQKIYPKVAVEVEPALTISRVIPHFYLSQLATKFIKNILKTNNSYFILFKKRNINL